jgi:serine protease Do
MRRLPVRLLALLFGFGLIVAACGGGDDSAGTAEGDQSDAAEDTTTTTEESTTTTVAEDDREDALDEFGDTVGDDLDMNAEAGDETYAEYVTVSDDTGFLTVDVPAEWSDVDGTAGLFGPDVTASTDVQQFFETYDVPGLEFQATDIQTNQTADEVLDAVSQGQASQCTPFDRQDYSDPLYTGRYQEFDDCAGTDTDFVWVAFEPADQSFHGVVGVQILSKADIDALERALETFVADV